MVSGDIPSITVSLTLMTRRAFYLGTPTMNVQIQGGNFSFEGDGLWGGQNVKK